MAGASHAIQRAESRVEDQVSARIGALDARAAARTEGRAEADGRALDADDAGPSGREVDASRETGAARRAEGRDERGTDRREGRDSDDDSPSEAPGAASAQRQDDDAPREFDGRERATAWSDASDAHGASSDLDSTNDGAPTAPGLEFQNAAQSASNAGHAAIAGAGAQASSAGLVAGSGSSAPLGQNAVGAVAGAAATERAARPAPQQNAPTPNGPSAADIERAEAILKQLRARFQLGQREIRLELQPRELGRIAVQLEMDGNTLKASFRADRAETLAVLEVHAPELRAWLHQDGVEVHEIEFSLAPEGDTAGFDARQDEAPERGARAQSQNSGPTDSDVDGPRPQVSASSGGVDLVV